MVKIWTDEKWLYGELRSNANVVVIAQRFFPIDEDGFIRYGRFRYRLFSAEFKGGAVGYKSK